MTRKPEKPAGIVAFRRGYTVTGDVARDPADAARDHEPCWYDRWPAVKASS